MFEDQVIVEEPTIAPKSKITLAITNNEILEVEYKIQRILPIVLEGDARVEYDNQWQTYFERKSQLEKKHRQELSMIQVQWMQVLLDKMKHDPYWENKSELYDPLILLKLIEKQ